MLFSPFGTKSNGRKRDHGDGQDVEQAGSLGQDRIRSGHQRGREKQQDGMDVDEDDLSVSQEHASLAGRLPS
jgi:hypothetical protein